jgi:two-component system, OmpR family, response regulator
LTATSVMVDPVHAGANVLVIDDDVALGDAIHDELESRGYRVRVAKTLDEGLSEARLAEAAILIVDRMLNDADAVAMMARVRREGVRTPVLFISCMSSIYERIRGLKAGGDDYLVKSFAMAELSARVEALLRRLEDTRLTRLTASGLEMDLIEQTVRRGDARIDLLPREFKLLGYFLRRPGQVITRAMLLTDVRRNRFTPETNVVEVHIGNLRRKIDVPGEPSLIRNIRGAGFMFDAGP